MFILIINKHFESVAFVLLTFIVIASAFCLFHYLFKKKKAMRLMELKMHINNILDIRGCAHAIVLFKECQHISKHYGIPLSSADYEKSLDALFCEAVASDKRYWARQTAFYNDFTSATLRLKS